MDEGAAVQEQSPVLEDHLLVHLVLQGVEQFA